MDKFAVTDVNAGMIDTAGRRIKPQTYQRRYRYRLAMLIVDLLPSAVGNSTAIDSVDFGFVVHTTPILADILAVSGKNLLCKAIAVIACLAPAVLHKRRTNQITIIKSYIYASLWDARECSKAFAVATLTAIG